MKTFFDPNLLSELIDQSHNPPGNDRVLGNFYTALVKMTEENHLIVQILIQIKKKRPGITNKHLVNLLYRAFQSIKFEQKDLSYKEFSNVKLWQNELEKLLSNEKTREKFKEILSTRSTTTTIYQRYIGPYAIISHFWDGQNVSIADLGCGGNYGLRGIEINEPFKKIEDLTLLKTVLKLLSKRINIKRGLAIDKENPDNLKVKQWRMACSFYPKELGELNNIKKFEDRIRLSKKTTFVQTNLLTSKALLKKSVDVVILSTILYQLNLQEQLTIIEKAKEMIKPGGLLILQDFAAKNLTNPHHLDFNDSWFGKAFRYRTFIAGSQTDWKFLELFKWNNGRCFIVKPGEDFKKVFFPGNQLKTSKAAFAHSTS